MVVTNAIYSSSFSLLSVLAGGEDFFFFFGSGNGSVKLALLINSPLIRQGQVVIAHS